MSSDVVILVPRRADHGTRDRLWAFARAVWSDLFPDWPIIEGHHDDGGPFSRSAAVNAAAELAGEWNVALVIDADVVPDPHAVTAAVEIARTGRPAIAFDHRKHLTARGTDRILVDGYRGSWEGLVKTDLTTSVSGAFAVNRDLWLEVGGFDELFVGWGWEDVAFRIATETYAGAPPARVVGDLWHLWHPKSPGNDRTEPTFVANRTRGDRYKAARWDREAIGELLDEAGAARSLRPPNPPRATPTRIPRILHRTVPEVTTEEADGFWRRAGELHPGWTLLDHRDPLDPAEWPETGDLWPRCTSGAQKAGLIRLEALYRWGGIYVDSDVELYRSLEPLLGVDAFAAWEDPKVIPDAVLGARPGHPAFAVLLERARAEILAGAGAWASGPGITTAVFPGRPDVLLLPPGSFYPYHYTEKDRRDEDHAAGQPWALGAHHWAHSWRGK